MLWLPVLVPVLLGLLSIVGDQHIVKVVALVHGPDLHCHCANVIQVLQRLLVLKVVWVSNLARLPHTLQHMLITSAHAIYGPYCEQAMSSCEAQALWKHWLISISQEVCTVLSRVLLCT